MRRFWLPASLLVVACSLIGWQVLLRDSRAVPERRQTGRSQQPAASDAPAQHKVVAYQRFLDLLSASQDVVDRSIEEIDRGWGPGSAAMLLEVARVAKSRSAFAQPIVLLQRNTGQEFESFDSWYHWVWSRRYDPHPQYAQFKSELYSRIDERFSEYFEKTEDARIRLDEIRWGGVKRDGIPPLKNPKMISPAEATYLDADNVVFGVRLNGDARCYPKRILAWHEMFKDTIGGVPVCGAY